MLKTVTITNFAGETLLLELANPWELGLAVTDIDGIGPAEADINTTDYASTDGSFFNSARVKNRNIVLSIKPLDNVEHNRHAIYDYFPTKKPVTLLFTADERELEITGYVEHNEIDIFDSFETAQISIICPNPYLHTPGDGINELFSGIDAEFEFPFECYPPEKYIIFGEILKLTEKIIVYEGEADTGMVMRFHALGDVHDLMIYNANTREVMYIDSHMIEVITGHDIQEGDDLTISTVVGDKWATLYRAGRTYNILNAINKDADWMQIRKGSNRFIYSASEGVDLLECSFVYYALYDGV